MGVADDGLGVIEPAVVSQVVRSRTAKASRAQKRVPAETVKLGDGGAYARGGHIGKGHDENV